MSKLRVVALGSSFAAGPGIEPIVDKTAWRSGNNYAHQLARKLDADLTDLTVSGATLDNVLDKWQRFLFTSLPPQLEGVPTDADIVTLTAGGNDLGYSLGMMRDSFVSSLGPLQYLLGREKPTANIELSELTEKFRAVIRHIKDIAPKARIYLVEYVNVFGTSTRPYADAPLSRLQIDGYICQSETLSSANNDAAKDFDNVEVVSMSSVSQGHELGSETPWVDGFGLGMLPRGVAPYHPNILAHNAIADSIFKQIERRTQSQ